MNPCFEYFLLYIQYTMKYITKNGKSEKVWEQQAHAHSPMKLGKTST